MTRIKIILSYLFGLVLSICLFLLCALLIGKKTVLDKSFVYRLMDENNYYDKVYTSINEDIMDYMTSSGLEKEVLDGVVDRDKVESDIKNYTDSLYTNNTYVVDTKELNTKLNNNIKNYLKKLNLGIDNSNELNLFVSDVEKIYREEVSFYNTIDILKPYISRIDKIINKVIIIDLIICLVLSLFMLLLRIINVGSCIMSSGFILFLVKLFIYERIDSSSILIVSDHFSLIIRSMFSYINKYMIIMSIALVISGFILCLFKSKKND